MASIRIEDYRNIHFVEEGHVENEAGDRYFFNTDVRRTRKAAEVIGNVRHKTISAAKRRLARAIADGELTHPPKGLVTYRLARVVVSYEFIKFTEEE